MRVGHWFHAGRFSRRFIAISSAIGVLAVGGGSYALAAGVIGNGSGGWTTCTSDAHADVASDMIVRNNGSERMCLSSPNYGDNFKVTASSADTPWADFPNIYTGCEYDGANSGQLCTRGHSTPPRLSSIGSDISSVSYHMPTSGFAGNASYDIWFNKTGGTPYGRDNGAEVMIWLGANGVGSPGYTRTVTIDGTKWGYDSWRAVNSGGSWNYIRYWRLSGYGASDSSVRNLNLKPFYNDAVKQGTLSNSWYLTGTQFGFETSSGGEGLAVKNFSDSIQGTRRYLGGLQHKS